MVYTIYTLNSNRKYTNEMSRVYVNLISNDYDNRYFDFIHLSYNNILTKINH